MDALVVMAVQLGALWTVLFATLLMMSKSWAFGFARWSFRIARRVVAWPFLLIGHAIRGRR